MTTPTFEIRPLTRDDAPAWRELRLEALTNHPEAFSSSPEEFVKLDAEAVAARVAGSGPEDALFGVFIGDELSGCAGFTRDTSLKARHAGLMWGVYLRPALRGMGAGEALMVRLIDHARRHVEILKCAVSPLNRPARSLYLRHGFKTYGVEPRALRVGGRDLDEELMALIFD